MVTLVDVPSDELTVVLDPTNPGIGIYKDGKIIMFNRKEKKFQNIHPKKLMELL